MILIDGKKVAADIRAELKEKYPLLKQKEKMFPDLLRFLLEKILLHKFMLRVREKRVRKLDFLPDRKNYLQIFLNKNCLILLKLITKTLKSTVYSFSFLFQSTLMKIK